MDKYGVIEVKQSVFEDNNNDAEKLYSACEEYIKRQTSYEFKTLEFLNSIK